MDVTNYQPGARGVNMADGTTLWVESGQTVTLDKGKVKGDLPDFGKPGDHAQQTEADRDALLAENERLRAQLASYEGGVGGALPSLTGKNKEALYAIAAAEGVEVADDATNAQIVEAIEAKRASA